jgi:hypothetical protein
MDNKPDAKERQRQRAREHYLRNRETYLQRAKAAQEADPARHAANVRRHYDRNREQINARKVAALDSTPGAREKARAAANAWRLQNPEQARELGRIGSANRRARIRADANRLSNGLAEKLLRKQQGKCTSCRCNLSESGYHIDHMTPIALGGENSDSNAQLLCPPCNQQKGAKHPVDFMQQRGYLL